MSGVIIQIIVTRTLDQASCSNLNRWLQGDKLLRSQVTQANASRAKSALLIQ